MFSRIRGCAALLAATAMVSGLAVVSVVSARPASASPSYSPIWVNTPDWSGSTDYMNRPPGLTEDSHGVVHLQGALKRTPGSNDTLLGCTGTLPLCGYAPPGRTVYTIAHTLGGTYADISIDSGGRIWLISSPNTNTSFVSLEGISYSVGSVTGGGPVSQLQLAPNWYSYTPQYNYGASTASWWEDSDQTVHFEGGVQELTRTSGYAQLIGWIPTYAAPWQGDVYTIVHTLGGTYADLHIAPDGSIYLLPSGNTNAGFVSLEGVTYSRLGAAGFHPFGPAAGWSAATCCGSAPLGWYKDPDGIVHLEGGVTQGAGGSNQIATIDPSAAPPANVFTIVHTYGGTYADLMITSGGAISVIDATGAPAATNPSFVSLDGVTYQR